MAQDFSEIVERVGSLSAGEAGYPEGVVLGALAAQHDKQKYRPSIEQVRDFFREIYHEKSQPPTTEHVSRGLRELLFKTPDLETKTIIAEVYEAMVPRLSKSPKAS